MCRDQLFLEKPTSPLKTLLKKFTDVSMANRRCFRTLSRYLQSINLNLQSINLNPISQSITHSSTNALYQPPFLRAIHHIFNKNNKFRSHSTVCTRHFSSKYSDGDDDDEEDEESEGEDDADNENESIALSPEDKVKDAAEIGYSVIGPLQLSDRVFKPYEPVFAVIQIGSHQFKVSNRDTIYVERLKYCDVNDKVILNKVLMLGSESQTIIGRPVLPDAAVHAVVEEHALDAKVIIFKKKRRKNYRRTKGHRQELTKLRITDILGIEKPEKTTSSKTEKKEKPTPLKTEKKEKPVKLAVGA